MRYWGKYTFAHGKMGNGSKQFGVALWFNSQRVGLQLNVWTSEVQLMREFR